MTSIIKVQDIQNATGDNIIKEASNTITIGASGDTTNIVGTLQNNGASVGNANTPNFRARASSNITLTQYTPQKLTFGTEEWDTASAFDTSTSRFTVPTGEGGKYFFKAHSEINNVLEGRTTQLRFYINNSWTSPERNLYEIVHSGNTRDDVFYSTVLELSAGDYVEIYIYTDNDTGKTTSANVTHFFWLQNYRIG